MGKEFVALLGGSVEADGIIYLVVCGERYLLVAAIDRARRGIDKMLNTFLV